ncbi:MAG: type secretion system secreted protein VgrG, partial [Acidobacteriota bacterium]|nr:type secretion system secreted protein VgrG [Acidobacteriota bacterium]
TGTGALANPTGVYLANGANNNTVGGTAAGAGNVISGNGKGVSVAAGTGNAILSNSIYGNTSIGIDLTNDGVTINDGTKSGALANSGMDTPAFTTMTLVGSTLTISGYVGSAPGQTTFASASVQVFKSDNDSSGYGEGQTYLGTLTADASGNFSGTLTATLTLGDKITGTATDASNNTSEFAANVTSAAPPHAPSLGAAASFAVLAGTTITSTGLTVVSGNVGVSPGTAVTGFPPGVIQNGQIYSGGGSLAGPAEASALTAYNDLKGQACLPANNLSGKILGVTTGAVTLAPGIYCFDTSAQLTTTLTLNDGGDPNAIFIFQIGTTLTTASGAQVVMSSGGRGANVYWQIGTSATIGTFTALRGNVIASTSITMTTSASTTGRLFALDGAVTMDTNAVDAVPGASAPPNVALLNSVTPSGTQPPGTDLVYTVAFTNGGGQAARVFFVIDPVPAQTDFKLGSPSTVLATTGMTVAVEYSNDNAATWNGTPVSGGGGALAGYDRAVTHVRWRFTGNLSQISPNNTGSVSFTARIR